MERTPEASLDNREQQRVFKTAPPQGIIDITNEPSAPEFSVPSPLILSSNGK